VAVLLTVMILAALLAAGLWVLGYIELAMREARENSPRD
jgi:hypothetical protein